MADPVAGTDVLTEEGEYIQDQSVQQLNIEAATAVSDAVRTTFGPNGAEKMLVDRQGELHITRDGRTIVDEMEIEHPPAELVRQVAENQHEAFGAGVTTALILTGELLGQAETLLDWGLHPTNIIQGYLSATRLARDAIESAAISVKRQDITTLEAVARTAMAGNVGRADETFPLDVVDAVRSIPEHKSLEYIKIKSVVEGGDSEFVNGCVVEKDPAIEGMPTRLDAPTIAITDTPIEGRDSERLDAVSVETPDDLEGFHDHEASELDRLVSQILDVGPDVVISQEGIDSRVAERLRREGILAIQYLVDRNIRRLAKSTGSTIVYAMTALTEADLGAAGVVEQRDVEGHNFIFFRECESSESVSFVLRGVSEPAKDEVKRGVKDGFTAVKSVHDDERVVPGGGAIEAAVARHVASNAAQIDDRAQLAVSAFSDAMYAVPQTLARHAGSPPVRTVADLRSRHDAGESQAGITAEGSVVNDIAERGVLEPSAVKTGSVVTAAEAAMLVLRIDDIFVTDRSLMEG
jgi:chaperonin GroEL (HSP60 family)